VNRLVTLSAFLAEGYSPSGSSEWIVAATGRPVNWLRNSLSSYVEMSFVTLQTEKGLILLQQISGNRTVRNMAGHAVLGYRRVIENKRALLLRVALQAEFAQPFVRME
jgi:hypothetical protein